MNDSPTIALLIPVFNGENYIFKFCQELKTFKLKFNDVIFYDDGSSDKSLSLIEASGFNYLSSEINRGAGYARNLLARSTTCDYVHFHDVDDEFSPLFNKLLIDIITKNDADVVFGNSDWLDKETREVLIKWRYSKVEMMTNLTAYFLANPLGIINTIYKRDLFLEVKGFNEEIKCWEDADIHVKLANSGATFKYIDEVVAFSIRHSGGISRDQLWCWDCRLRFLEMYLANFQSKLPNGTFESEIKKVQNVFIKSGKFYKLKKIIDLKERFDLNLNLNRIYPLYLINKVLPLQLLSKLIKPFIK